MQRTRKHGAHRLVRVCPLRVGNRRNVVPKTTQRPCRCRHRYEANNRLAVAGDHDFFACLSLIQQLRKLTARLVHIDDLHSSTHLTCTTCPAKRAGSQPWVEALNHAYSEASHFDDEPGASDAYWEEFNRKAEAADNTQCEARRAFSVILSHRIGNSVARSFTAAASFSSNFKCEVAIGDLAL